ncbi:uncharacterized protein LOC132637805 [Lycium barbarum]|uniref:uncharacterized protein LOC132637805 n=1 Tax=Lycium barbarum TaxID=112863 RepID=UPI00293EBBF5|nr:uncharacterized protein LOC132637805 [Lycium barbarum]
MVESRRVSSVAESDRSVDLENGNGETKLHVEKIIERDCRICHLSLLSSGTPESGVAIEFGCSCKDDLATAHRHCAKAWFKIKGNKKKCNVDDAFQTVENESYIPSVDSNDIGTTSRANNVDVEDVGEQNDDYWMGFRDMIASDISNA